MYTQCPHCQTCFRIAEAHLKAAKGKVRCGSCKEIFDATNHLYNTMPDAQAGKSPVAPPASKPRPIAKPAPPPKAPPPPPAPKHSSAPLPGISSAFGDEEHEHIDLGPATEYTPTPIIPERRNVPDQSEFMESMVRYNNLDEMSNIKIPGDTQFTDSFIRFVDDDENELDSNKQTTIKSESFSSATSIIDETSSDTDEAIANIKAQLSELGMDDLDDEVEDVSDSLLSGGTERASPYEDGMPADQPANTMERNAIDNMFLNFEEQIESPIMENDQDKLNADINALLDDAMALDNKKPAQDKRSTEEPSLEIEGARASDLINDTLLDADETLAQFEADLEHMKFEPQIDENVSIFDIDHADNLNNDDDSPIDFEQFDFDEAKPEKAKNETEEDNDFAEQVELSKESVPAETVKSDPVQEELLEDFLMDDESSTTTEPEAGNVSIQSDQFDDDFLPESNKPEVKQPVEDKTRQIGTAKEKSAKTSPPAKPERLPDQDEISEELPSLEHDIPKALRSSFATLERPDQPLWQSMAMGVGIVVLVLGLLSQLVIFRSYQLANQFPGMSSMLSGLCEVVTCRYSGEIDVEQIQLINRNVSSHPNQKNALLISTAFVNKASFDQPYPTIAIKLSDLSGETVATRYFKPEEYLENLYSKFLLMESGTPVHITLAVLDPGNDAVNFEFSFF